MICEWMDVSCSVNTPNDQQEIFKWTNITIYSKIWMISNVFDSCSANLKYFQMPLKLDFSEILKVPREEKDVI